MKLKTLEQHNQQSIWEHYNAPRSFTKTIEMERSLGGYQCQFEVSLKLYENNEQFPEVEYVSTIDAFDGGGRQVTNSAMLVKLHLCVEDYCKENIDTIISEIQRAEKKGRE